MTLIVDKLPMAIDPMSQLLPEKWYLIWLEIHNPHNPLIHGVNEVMAQMPKEERVALVKRAERIEAYCQIAKEAAKRAGI